MRGFLGGVSLGALVAAAGAAMLSLSVPLPKAVDVSAQTPQAVAPIAESAAATEVTTAGPDADLVEAVPVAPEDKATDDLSALADADTSPAARPQVGQADADLGTPAAESDSGQAVPQLNDQTDRPVVPVEALPQPSTPVQESDVVVATEPAQPPAPVVSTEAPVGDLSETDTGVTEIPTVVAEAVDAAPKTAPTVVVEVPSIDAPESGNLPTATVPSVADRPVTQGVPGESTEQAAEEEAEEVETRTAVLQLPTVTGETAQTTGPAIGTPVVPLTERRAAERAAAEGQGDITPFETYSVPFDLGDDRPLMSIVLMDDAQSIGAEALVGFPYPLSFAIDPQDPKAAEKMAARRAAGFEVLVLADLPREALPQDAETALQVWFDTLPEAIGVVEGPATGFQGNRPLADQVSAFVAATGRGMLTQDNGLNTVQKLAARDGVPSAVVFRDFDGAGQDPKAMRRFLDQAAFRANQEGAVIMFGRVRPDTISALLIWGLQDRASRVALAPVSAALTLKSAEQ